MSADPPESGAPDPAGGHKPMTFWDHLDELRSTLVRVALTTIVAMVASYALSDTIRDLLIQPFVLASAKIGPGAGSLILFRPTEGFIVQLKIALFAGLVLASPLNFWHLWRFVAPGLHASERRLALPFVGAATVLFLGGVAFGYRMLGYTTAFFLDFGTPVISNQWSLSAFIGFVTQMLVAFGLVFELPLVVFVLAKLGLVTQHTLRRYRRHSIVGIMVVAAVLTPPDPVSQVIMAIPLYVLYELSVLVCVLVLRDPPKSGDPAPESP